MRCKHCDWPADVIGLSRGEPVYWCGMCGALSGRCVDVKVPSRIDELGRLNLEARRELADAHGVLDDIDLLRSSEGNSVTINSDNPEADRSEDQSCVDVCGDFTDWKVQRFYKATWTEALAKAASAYRPSASS